MNHNKLIAVGLILAVSTFLVAGCLGGEEKGNKTKEGGEEIDYKDCGKMLGSLGSISSLSDESAKCLMENFEKCKSAKATVASSTGEETQVRIEGGEPENCKVTWKIIKLPAKEEFEKEEVTCTIKETTPHGEPDFAEAFKQERCTGNTKILQYYFGGLSGEPKTTPQPK